MSAGRPRGVTLEQLRQLRPADAGGRYPSVQSLIDLRNGITRPHPTPAQERAGAQAMRAVAARLPQPRRSPENAPDSKEGQAACNDLTLTTSTLQGSLDGCTIHGTD